MYAVATKLPDFEKFGLASQVRRAAVSLTNNIAEGHGRFHYLDQIKFLLQARGSLQELMDDLNVCQDENYLPATDVGKLKGDGSRVAQLLGGYIRYLRQCKTGQTLGLREEPTLITMSRNHSQTEFHQPRRFTASTIHAVTV